MDFQRLFKRKQEDSAPPFAGDDAGDALKDRDVIIREGELLDGNSPARIDWSKVGGTVTVKAGKILGVLEGRARIKAGVLEELYPGKFTSQLNPETEFNIPLQVVVAQLQDIFHRTPLAVANLEDLETPFAELAREDEARFKKGLQDQPSVGQSTVPKSLDEDDTTGRTSGSALVHPGEARSCDVTLREQTMPTDGAAFTKGGSKRGGSDDDAESHVGNPPSNGARVDTESHLARSEQLKPAIERLGSAPEFRHAPSTMLLSPPEIRHVQTHSSRREGYERLQELYLTDEPLDGAKIANLVFQLPRVTGVVIMRSDGAVLAAELGGGITEELLSLVPDFVKRVSVFTEIIPGGPTRFITFFGHALQISLVRGGDVLMLVGHEGKNLPPGLRERLIATTQALNNFYGPQP
jgi:hypothetical protein